MLGQFKEVPMSLKEAVHICRGNMTNGLRLEA